MEKIKIIFLGTSNAIPTKKRNHTAILLSHKNEKILIDCGEGTQRQFKIADISATKLTRILLTHWHGDHILGLPGIFQTLAMSNYQKTLELHGPKKTLQNFSLFNNLFNFKIKIKVHEHNEGKILEEKDFIIDSKQMSHDTPCLAYSFATKDKIHLDKNKLKKLKIPNSPMLGELQKGKDIIFKGKKIKAKNLTYIEKGKKVTIILDTKFNSNAIKLAQNSDLLICESSFSKQEEKQAHEYNHMTAIESALIAKKANVKKLILTHLSQRYEHKPKIIENEAKKIFKNTKLANDFDVVEI
ncbi:ribonuclease Z [Candidatus Pacearchaeota archaeon]|nr:ribonuclease Z [Candidatus Pacearchaeota archaeon]